MARSTSDGSPFRPLPLPLPLLARSGSRSSASLRTWLKPELFISRSLKRDRSASKEEAVHCPRRVLGLMVLCLSAVSHFIRYKQQDPSPKSIDEFEPRSTCLLPIIDACGVFFPIPFAGRLTEDQLQVPARPGLASPRSGKARVPSPLPLSHRMNTAGPLPPLPTFPPHFHLPFYPSGSSPVGVACSLARSAAGSSLPSWRLRADLDPHLYTRVLSRDHDPYDQSRQRY